MFRVAEDFGYPAQRNLLLASLSDAELHQIAPHLERRTLPHGARVDALTETAGLVLFPETAIVCICTSIGDRKGLGLGMIGREGALGWHALTGGGTADDHRAVNLQEGSVLAIDAARLRTVCAAHPSLLRTFLSFAYLFSLQLAATLRAGMGYAVDVRLARWLLMFHDRAGDDAFAITHDLLAGLLGVRRATVTDTLHVLEGERLITCTRGLIVVRSRAGLEARVGPAYGGAERAYDALIAPFGK